MTYPWEGEDEARRIEQPATDARRELQSYLWGLGLAVLLTAIAFGLVAFRLVTFPALLPILGLLALAQIAVHFRFFLHIDLSKQKREDLQLILFTGLLILIMVGGSVWIMTNLDQRMMG